MFVTDGFVATPETVTTSISVPVNPDAISMVSSWSDVVVGLGRSDRARAII